MDSGLVASNISRSINVISLIADCCENVRAMAEKDNKQILLEPYEKEIIVKTDDEKLEIALTNILANAVRHAKKEIFVSYGMLDNNVVISVQDDGSGILEKDMPHIFERFYKGSKGNFGLGLAICENIMARLGGGVTAENLSRPQRGAKFTVTLDARKNPSKELV
jgi:signal transduction histidine kinase